MIERGNHNVERRQLKTAECAAAIPGQQQETEIGNQLQHAKPQQRPVQPDAHHHQTTEQRTKDTGESKTIEHHYYSLKSDLEHHYINAVTKILYALSLKNIRIVGASFSKFHKIMKLEVEDPDNALDAELFHFIYSTNNGDSVVLNNHFLSYDSLDEEEFDPEKLWLERKLELLKEHDTLDNIVNLPKITFEEIKIEALEPSDYHIDYVSRHLDFAKKRKEKRR